MDMVLRSTGQVAKLLSIPRHRIEYAVANGHLPEARFRFLDKRCWTVEEVQQIADYFEIQTAVAADNAEEPMV